MLTISSLSPTRGVSAGDSASLCNVVTDFGAIGDNKTEDTDAVAAAFKSCSSTLLPAGYTFLLRPVELFSHTHIVIEGTIVAWQHIDSWPNSTNKVCPISPYETPVPTFAPQRESLLWGIALRNVTISGGGTIDGQGWRWWPLRNDTSHGEYWHHCRPKLISVGGEGNGTIASPTNVDIGLSGITLKDSPFWTTSFRSVRNLAIRRVTVRTTSCGYSVAPNTDGFNIQGENVLIEDSRVRNGDDCVPLFPPTRNVTVRNLTCECGNGPAVCIWPRFSIPGRGGDVRDVRFDGVTLNATNNAVSVKSLPSFVGRARNVSFSNMHLIGVTTGVAINFKGQGQAGFASGASADSVLIENVSGTVAANAGHFLCSAQQPCTGVRMRNVTLRAEKASVLAVGPYECENVQGTAEQCTPNPCHWISRVGDVSAR